MTKVFEYGQTEMEYLRSRDEILGAAIRRLGKVERVVMPDFFTALTYAIVGQLISAKATQTIWGRMQKQLGEITAINIARQTPDDIQACGLTMKKAMYIYDSAQAIKTGTWNVNELYSLSDAEVIQRLTMRPGIGQWTAEMLLLHAMERQDVLSWGDIAIRRGIMKLYGLAELSKAEFEQYRRLYSPYGSVASIYLWEISFE